MQNTIVIGPLTKISLIIDAISIDRDCGPIRTRVPFEFIYGIGTEGISAFEKKLHGLEPGARIKIRITEDDIQSYFEHLQCPILEALKIRPPFDLNIEVRSVTPASHRELIHALANKTGSGCDCGCGCSC